MVWLFIVKCPKVGMRSDARALEKLKNSLSVTSAIVAHVLDDTPV
jgi:hypothetical protein